MKKDQLPVLVGKSDPFFGVVAAAMLGAIILAFVNPSHAAEAGAVKHPRSKQCAGACENSNGGSGTRTVEVTKAGGATETRTENFTVTSTETASNN